MTIAFYAVFIVAIMFGVFATIFPERVVAIRHRLQFSNSVLSGGWFYATPKRVRIMGSLLVALGGIAVASRIFVS